MSFIYLILKSLFLYCSGTSVVDIKNSPKNIIIIQEIIIHPSPKNIAFVSVALNNYIYTCLVCFIWLLHRYINYIDNNTSKRKSNMVFCVASMTESYN